MIRLLTPTDAAEYRAIRLRALMEHPSAFGSSIEEFEQLSMEDIAQRLGNLPDSPTFGAFVDDVLSGIGSLIRYQGPKRQHRGIIAGMYVVTPGQGLGRQILEAALDYARTELHLHNVIIAVIVGNERARSLYLQAGFTSFGVSPAYLMIDGKTYDMEWMNLFL